MFKKLLICLLPLVTLVGCNKSTPVKTDMLYIKCLSGETSIGYSYDGDDAPMNLEWSKDLQNWSTVDIVEDDTITSLKSGETISFRGNNPDGFNKNWFSSDDSNDPYRVLTFTFDNSNDNIELEIGGNIMSLLSTDNFANMVDTPSRGCFSYLFCKFGNPDENEPKKGNIDASRLVLPATQLNDYAYCSLFEGSTITKSPLELITTNAAVGCYESMFDSCSFLLTAPVIKLENLLADACRYMFDDCSQLNIVKDSGTKIFTCPDTSAKFSVAYMFTGTKSWQGTVDPQPGEVFYYN